MTAPKEQPEGNSPEKRGFVTREEVEELKLLMANPDTPYECVDLVFDLCQRSMREREAETKRADELQSMFDLVVGQRDAVEAKIAALEETLWAYRSAVLQLHGDIWVTRVDDRAQRIIIERAGNKGAE